jgi:hypothetical protein
MSNVVEQVFISQIGCDNIPGFTPRRGGDLDAALNALQSSCKGTLKEAVLYPYKYAFYALFRSNHA